MKKSQTCSIKNTLIYCHEDGGAEVNGNILPINYKIADCIKWADWNKHQFSRKQMQIKVSTALIAIQKLEFVVRRRNISLISVWNQQMPQPYWDTFLACIAQNSRSSLPRRFDTNLTFAERTDEYKYCRSLWRRLESASYLNGILLC